MTQIHRQDPGVPHWRVLSKLSDDDKDKVKELQQKRHKVNNQTNKTCKQRILPNTQANMSMHNVIDDAAKQEYMVEFVQHAVDIHAICANADALKQAVQGSLRPRKP